MRIPAFRFETESDVFARGTVSAKPYLRVKTASNKDRWTTNIGRSALQILVADELDIVRDGLSALLCSHAGWEICAEAINGREAVEKALQFQPDLGVLDSGLPEVNGLEATRQIRKALPGTEIILLTLQHSQPLAQEALDAGAHSLILKTDAKRLLIPAIESLAQHRQPFSTETSEFATPRHLHLESRWTKKRRPRSRLTPREREI